MPDLDLDTIQDRSDAAFAGPWTVVAETEHYGILLWASGVDYDPRDPTGQTAMQTQELIVQRVVSMADADFIAHAREDVPALVAEVRRLRAENEHLRHGGSVPPPITTGATT